jgi:hypothetical protein
MMRFTAFTLAAFDPQVRAWRGEAPLWETFWIQGVAVSALLGLGFAAALMSGATVLARGLLLVIVGYTGWVVVAIWRCAERASASRWAVMAQALSIAWAINTLLLSLFLALTLR